MNHTALSRPELPGSTPSPGPMGLRNVYATKLPATLNTTKKSSGGLGGIDQTGRTGEMQRTTQRATQEKTIKKIVSKLPYALRETVMSVVEMVLTNADDAHKHLEMSRMELSSLREQLAKKSHEAQTLRKNVDNYKEKIRGLEDSIEVLKDNIESNTRFTVKNKSAIARLAATNRMLFDSLEALQAGTNQWNDVKRSGSAPQIDGPGMDTGDLDGTGKRGGKLAPLAQTQSAKHLSPSKKFAKDNEESLYQNDKLRESLLRVAREHYKSMKYAENLDSTVTELRVALRAQEQQNRKLKAEVDEYRSLLQTEHADEKVTSGGEAGNIKTGLKNFDIIDQRLQVSMKIVTGDTGITRKGCMCLIYFYQLLLLCFLIFMHMLCHLSPSNCILLYHITHNYHNKPQLQTMIEKNGFDPIDGIQLLRRIVAHMATAPNNLSTHAMVLHLVSREALRIFEVDMLCLFIRPPGADGSVMHRFTVKSASPTELDLKSTSSLAGVVMRSSKVTRINVISNSVFNHEVDCVSGVAAKRCMSLPLYNVETKKVFGCIHMINKRHNDLFSDTDELFGLIFADQASLLLTSCNMFDQLSSHAGQLQSILESSTALFKVIPDPHSLAVTRSLSPGVVLNALEEISKEILKCSNTRAFLVSDYLNMPPGQLVMLQHVNMSSVSKDTAMSSIITVPAGTGIAGHVVQSRSIYEMDTSGYDMYVNPTVDVDPIMSSMLAFPIMDLYGTVVGCLELVLGSRSPGLRHTEDFKDQGLLFVEAAQWFTHQIATPLQYLINYVGKPVHRPISTPSRISRTPGKSGARSHFFSFQLEGADGKPPGTGHHPITTGGPIFNNANSYSNRPFSGSGSPSGAAGGAVAGDGGGGGGGGDFLSIPLSDIKTSIDSPVPTDRDVTTNAAAAAESGDKASIDKTNEVHSAELDRVQQESVELSTEVARLAEALSNAQAGSHALQEELESSQTEASQLRSEIEAIRAQLQEAEELAEKQKAEIVAKASTDEAMKALDAALAKQAQHDAEVKQLVAQVEALRDERDTLQLEAQAGREQAATLEQQVAELTAASEALRAVSEAQSSSSSEVAALTTEKQRLEEENAAHVAEVAQWKESYESMHNAYNMYKEQAETHQQDNEGLREQQEAHQAEVQTLTKQVQDLQEQLKQQQQQQALEKEEGGGDGNGDDAAIKAKVEEMEARNVSLQKEGEELKATVAQRDSLQKEVEELKATVAQRDAVQALLQAQVLRMAGQNVKDIDQAISNAGGLAAASPPPPSAGGAGAPGGSVRTGPPPNGAPPISRGSSGLPPANQSVKSASGPDAAAVAGDATGTGTGTATAGDGGIAAAASVDSAWAPVTDDYGQTYYYNNATGESSWTNPDDPNSGPAEVAAAGSGGKEAAVAAAAALGATLNDEGMMQKGDWVQNFDGNGQEYWVHQVSGQSLWELPSSVSGVKSVDEEDSSFVGAGSGSGGGGIYDTTNSQYSASAGDYVIEL